MQAKVPEDVHLKGRLDWRRTHPGGVTLAFIKAADRAGIPAPSPFTREQAHTPAAALPLQVTCRLAGKIHLPSRKKQDGRRKQTEQP
jgi:hypothetical protein